MFFRIAARIVLLLSCLQPIVAVYGDTVPSCHFSIKYSLKDDGLRLFGSDNPAACSFSGCSFLSASFENRFCLKELMSEKLDAVFRCRENAFSVGVASTGYRHYGEVTVSAGYARSFGGHVAVGLRSHYMVSYASECASIHSFTFDVSLYARAGKNCGIGFSVYNPARLKYGIVGKESLPVRLHLDFSYQIGSSVLLLSIADWELKTRIAFYAGVKYKVKCLILTAVARLPDPSGNVGVDLVYKRFLFGVFCHYLYPLGFVPRASVTILL